MSGNIMPDNGTKRRENIHRMPERCRIFVPVSKGNWGKKEYIKSETCRPPDWPIFVPVSKGNWGNKKEDYIKCETCALAAWLSGHRVRLQNRRSRVRIPPGCKVFRNLYIAVLLS
jgi:hypothetical protein